MDSNPSLKSPTRTEVDAFIDRLVADHPEISAVWLFGSRANGRARAESDWDLLAFANQQVFSIIHDSWMQIPEGVDLFVVTDGNSFRSPKLRLDHPSEVKRGVLSLSGSGDSTTFALPTTTAVASLGTMLFIYSAGSNAGHSLGEVGPSTEVHNFHIR